MGGPFGKAFLPSGEGAGVTCSPKPSHTCKAGQGKGRGSNQCSPTSALSCHHSGLTFPREELAPWLGSASKAVCLTVVCTLPALPEQGWGAAPFCDNNRANEPLPLLFLG